MSLPGEWFRRVRYLLNRRREDDLLRHEMEAHRERLGDPRRFGNVALLREDARDVWGWRWLDDFGQDLRFAARTLGRGQRPYAATAILTLAIGVGSATAVFSVVNGLLLRPLPFPHPDRLVALHGSTPHPAEGTQVTNLPIYRDESQVFDAFAAYDVGARYISEGNLVERVMVVRTEPEFFSILGVPALYGRTYDRADGPTAVVSSEDFWRRRFGSNPGIIGQPLTLDNHRYTIVGIMPDSFQFPYRAGALLEGPAAQQRSHLWVPYEQPLSPRARLGTVIGRLKANVTLPEAQAELDGIAAHVDAIVPNNNGRRISLEPLARSVVAPAMRRLVLLFFAAVVIVLALACANIANLSLARMMARQREVAVRASLGASTSRLGRQLLTESLFIAFAGGATGLLLAWWTVRRLAIAVAAYLPRAHEIVFDWRVFLFMFGVCMAVGVTVAVAPVLLVSRSDPRASLYESSAQSTMSRRQRRLRDALVVAEVALAFVLGASAAATFGELRQLQRTDPGIDTHSVVTVHIGKPRGVVPLDSRPLYDIVDRVGQLPGVRAAGFVQMLPLQSWGWAANAIDFVVRGRPQRNDEFTMELRFVTPGYFEAMGIPIRRGRGFSAVDIATNPRVIIVNETLARRAFPGEDPIGLVTTRGTIVGTIGDVRQAGLDRAPLPELYTPIAQNWSQISDLGMTLVVRAAERPESMIDAISFAIHDVDPGEAIFAVKTMDTVVRDSLSGFAIALSILSGFAILAIALALSGTYGVISYIASSRMREFAIRVALGSGAARVSRYVLGRAVLLTGIGLAAGLVVSFAAMPLLGAAPVSVDAPGPFTLLIVGTLITFVAAMAALVPARRAARVDPIALLRAD